LLTGQHQPLLSGRLCRPRCVISQAGPSLYSSRRQLRPHQLQVDDGRRLWRRLRWRPRQRRQYPLGQLPKTKMPQPSNFLGPGPLLAGNILVPSPMALQTRHLPISHWPCRRPLPPPAPLLSRLPPPMSPVLLKARIAGKAQRRLRSHNFGSRMRRLARSWPPPEKGMRGTRPRWRSRGGLGIRQTHPTALIST
jgi:hypothetical protein